MKATSFMKSRKFLGIPGFWSRMKERGAMVKDVSCLLRSHQKTAHWSFPSYDATQVWGLAMGVHGIVEDMNKLQMGELPEEELRALEADLTGKVISCSIHTRQRPVSRRVRPVCKSFATGC